MMLILDEKIEKKYRDLEKRSELFSGYEKWTRYLRKRISENKKQIQLNDKMKNDN